MGERMAEVVVDLFLEPFRYGFMRNALAAGLLTVIASSLVGTWVVMRGLAFIGDALAHGVLPGIAIAYLLGGNLLLGAAFGAAVMVGGISLVTARSRIGEDTAIGLLFVGMLALGVAIISARGAYAGDRCQNYGEWAVHCRHCSPLSVLVRSVRGSRDSVHLIHSPWMLPLHAHRPLRPGRLWKPRQLL